jgi:hypothetical protein
MRFKYREVVSEFLSILRFISGKSSQVRKRRIIKSLGLNHNIQIIVETGTYLGQSTKFFAEEFHKVYSIELDLQLYNYSKNKLRKRKNVTLFCGNSKEMLPIIISDLTGPSIFFLDGHASGGLTSSGEEPSPIKYELHILENFCFIKDSIIICDDARGFDGTNSYPHINELFHLAARLNLADPRILEDMIIITPK